MKCRISTSQFEATDNYPTLQDPESSDPYPRSPVGQIINNGMQVVSCSPWDEIGSLKRAWLLNCLPAVGSENVGNMAIGTGASLSHSPTWRPLPK